MRKRKPNIFDNPTLYIVDENSDSIIAKNEWDVRENSPARRYQKSRDAGGEFVWIVYHMGLRHTKTKSYRKDWVIQ